MSALLPLKQYENFEDKVKFSKEPKIQLENVLSMHEYVFYGAKLV